MSNTEITLTDLHNLLDTFGKKAYLSGFAEEGTLEHTIMQKCEELFKLDYSLIKLDNTNASICPRYPEHILIPESEHGYQMNSTLIPPADATTTTTLGTTTSATVDINTTTSMTTPPKTDSGNVQHFVTFADQVDSAELTPTPTPFSSQLYTSSFQQQKETVSQQTSQANIAQNAQGQQTIYEALFDAGKIRELVPMARYARCRQRFVVPVMLYRGKFICRSATISRTPEMYGRKVVDAAFDYLNGTLASVAEFANPNGNGNSNGTANGNGNAHSNGNGNSQDEESDPTADSHMAKINWNSTPPSFSNDEVIKNDIKLLKALNVSTIVDLMVEKRKTKYFFSVSSSEKADDSQRYKDFTILCLPYPGCEFFKAFRDNNYVSQNLHYDWSQAFIDTRLSIPASGPAAELDINWSEYEKWDLVTLTQNYLKAALKYIQDESSGLLVHCISGWDRTPLFISLIRLSLWADGLIHQTLNEVQMAYFTLAYDWYLFGHQLPDRLSVGEDILIFCFHFLKYIWGDEFRVGDGGRKRTKTSSSSSSGIVIIKPDAEDETKDDFCLDMESNDSVSASSICDMPITESFYMCSTVQTPATSNATAPATGASTTTANTSTATSFFSNGPQTGRSPNFKRCRTSPIAVPGANASTTTRQRNDSLSSHSWQMVNDAGSVDSMSNGTSMMQRMGVANNMAQGSVTCGSTNSNGSTTSAEGACAIDDTDSLRPPYTLRRERLTNLRNCVIPAYGRMIGLRFNEGSGNLSTIVSSITEQFW